MDLAGIALGAGALFLSLMGWVYQLGYASARINRNEKDIATLNVEFRKEISESLRRIHEKIDSLPCKNPGWKRSDCGD